MEAGGSGRGERRGDGDLEAAVAGRLSAAAAELYGADQEAFTDLRKALAASAKAAGDKSAATAITALRKPTRAAWVVNRLPRADPSAPPRLAAMAAALRAAEQARDGPALRELSLARGALIDALTEQALALAGLPDPPPSLRAEVSATLTAALADPDVAAAFTAGTLDRAVSWSGFGAAGFAPADDASSGDASSVGALSGTDVAPARDRPGPVTGLGTVAERGARRPAPADPREPHRSPARRGAPGQTASTPAPRDPHGQAAARVTTPAPSRPPGQAAARAAAAEEQRLAREAAERAAGQRKNYQDAERTVAAAATAAAEAIAAEDRLEAEVRDLEERLIRTRADLTAARLAARRAEAAERRARQALDRLPRP